MPLIMLVQGCHAGQAKSLAQDGVAKFHEQLNAEQYHAIYSKATPEFQKSGTEADITEFFSAVHRKLGNEKSAEQKTFFVNFGTSGTVVTLTYATEFDSGSATEQFVWRVEGDHPLLLNYRIDSRALIVK